MLLTMVKILFLNQNEKGCDNLSDIIRCRLRINRVFFPKNIEDFESGQWCALSCEVLDLFDGEVLTNYHTRGGKDYINVNGNYYGTLDFDVEYNLTASYSYKEPYGHQYNIITMQKAVSLTNPFEQRKFLEMILTESQINLLYENLPNPFETIKNNDRETLLAIKGLGEAKVDKIIQAYQGNSENQSVYALVGSLGGTPKLANKLINSYNGDVDRICNVINSNPYLLIDDVDGIGWKKADSIAEEQGLPLDSVERIKAFINYYLKEMAQTDGHSWVSPDDLLETTLTQLDIDNSDNFITALYELQEEQTINWNEDKTKIYLSYIYRMEDNIAKELVRLSNEKEHIDINSLTSKLHTVEKKQGWKFTEEQLQAINTVIQNKVTIITGYGGTGKSSVVSGVLQLLNGYTFAQTALSGRAASRLSEITNQDGYTIHRLIGYNPTVKSTKEHPNPRFNSDTPLWQDIIILDEVSMIGASLFLKLLRAIKTGAKLIMIGDDGQLESIGLCNIFRDMLDSGVIPICRLTQIHRQAAKSGIITESIKVRKHTQLCPNGWVGEETRGSLKDFKLNVYNNKDLSQTKIIQEYKHLLHQGVNPRDIQIVVPLRERGEISVHDLNVRVQEIVNPSETGKPVITYNNGNLIYNLRLGDKVVVNTNNYKTTLYTSTPTDKMLGCPIYNGNIGYITRIFPNNDLVINFDLWGEVFVPSKYIKQIEPAYALTCHKLQGSESPYVIIGLDFSAFKLLTKEWLYTAITRAKKYCVLCAETKALNYCTLNSKVPFKRTFLKDLLIQYEKERRYETD